MATVLILGATSDIGIAIAKKFASEKFDVQLAARSPQLLGPGLRQILPSAMGLKCNAYAFDALKYGEHAAFFNSLSPVPDVTVCVFGILDEEDAGFQRLDC